MNLEDRLAETQRLVIELKRDLATEHIQRLDMEKEMRRLGHNIGRINKCEEQLARLEHRVRHSEESFTRHRKNHAEPDLSYMG